ncbi:MAG: hypothetical protein KAR31_07985, partial [Candidatus Omnitrophica bacterium]|nr:hypothetical protein [Candidatus Omnitrophota bacterium]
VTTVDADSAAAQAVLNVAVTTGFSVGDNVVIDPAGTGGGKEVRTIASIQAGASLTMTENLTYTHASPDKVSAVIFVDETAASLDFHLAQNDTAAKNAGTDLSADAYLAFSDDIDGESRVIWDIGADETLPTEFVATVMETGGNFDTLAAWEDAIDSEANMDMTDAGTRVIAGSLTRGSFGNNAGITQTTTGATAVCVYDTSTQMLIRGLSLSETPNATATWYPTANGNDGTNAWTPTNTGEEVRVTAEIDGPWTGGADATAVTISGFTTDATHYIKVYTTPAARHAGKWDDNKYALEVTTSYWVSPIRILEEYVRVEGLQLKATGSSGNWHVAIDITPPTSTSDIQISHNIIRGVMSGTADYMYGVKMGDSGNSPNTCRVWNNIIYGFKNGTNSAEGLTVYSHSPQYAYIYNNTCYGNRIGGYAHGDAHVVLKNNLFSGNDTDWDDYLGAPGVHSNNLTGDATSPDGAAYQNQVTTVDQDSANTGAILYVADTSGFVADDNIVIDPDASG